MTDDPPVCPNCGTTGNDLIKDGSGMYCTIVDCRVIKFAGEHDESQQPRDAIEGKDNQQGHPQHVVGFNVKRFYEDGDSGVVLECPNFRNHYLTDEEAVALAEFLLDGAKEDNDK